MIKIFFYFSILILISSLKLQAQNIDNCSEAAWLCAGNSVSGSTIAKTASGTDPALSCGDGVVSNSAWFIVRAINIGTCSITVSNINDLPGLDMEVYTGNCGSLVSFGQCASGDSLSAGKKMSVSFATTLGTTYYVMVDGNSGNQEDFDIIATTSNNAIIARPDPNFNPNPNRACLPFSSILDTTGTVIHGGSNLTYTWRINAVDFPSSGSDTTIVISTLGTTTVTFKICNSECGCKSQIQDIDAQNLFPSISFNPPVSCMGTSVSFSGSAVILPDPPHVPPTITRWDWNFGDPASGAANTISGPGAQNVNHSFMGAGPSFSVRLIVQGTCGPDTTFKTINLLVKPTIDITGPAKVCQGTNVNLSAAVSNGANPITYSWSGPGSYSCATCSATSISTLAAGGPYTISLSIIDSNGCMSDTTFDVSVNAKPTVNAGGFITVCKSDSAQLNAIPAGGLPPYTYQWSPSVGLNYDTIVNPKSGNTNGSNYCITVTDSNGCSSTPDCVTINQFPQPTIVPSSVNLCATQTPLQNTFTVNGSNIGSDYKWGMSPSYSRITGAAPDSSDIIATFPPVPGSYNFIALVTDGVTGCIDTVPTSFSVSAGLSMSVSGRNLICLGDTDTLTVLGATSYLWTASPAYPFTDSSAAMQIVSPNSNISFTIKGTQGTCTQTINYNLTVSPNPLADVDTIPAFCGCATVLLNGSGSTAGMSYLWTSQNGGLIVSPSNIVTNATLCGNDHITLLVTDTLTGCFSDSTIATVLRPKPKANVTVSPDIICNGVSTFISLNGTGSDTGLVYHWQSNNPAVVISDTTAYTTGANVSGPTVFSLTVTDLNGCDSTYSDTVNIYPLPAINADFPFLCTSDPVLHSTLSITGASPGSTYSWDTIPACAVPSSSSSSSQLFDFASCGAGVYNFTVSVNDPITTCTTVLSQSVTLVNGVTLSVSADTSFCEGGSAVLVASGANTFAWNTGDVTDTVIVNGLSAAGSPYSFTVIGTVGSCSDAATINVVVHPVPVAFSICCDSVICENDITHYNVSPSSPNNYFWTINGGSIAFGQGSDNILVNWNSIGLAMISVYDTTAFGCTSPVQSMNVIINPLPFAPVVTGPDTVCNDEIATYFVNANAGSIYNWTITGGNFISGPTGSVNTFQWTNAGTDSLTVFEQSSAGCIGPATSYKVKSFPRPAPVVVTGNTSVCDNITEIYSIVTNAGSTYTWNVLNDIHDTLNSTSDTLTVNWSSSGTGHIIIFEKNSFGCNSDTGDIPVSISQHPQILIPIDSASICNNTPYPIIANANTLNVRWYSDGTGNFNDSTIAAATYIPSVTDTGFIHLLLVARNPPCNNDSGFVVLHIDPSPVVTITGPVNPICFGTLDSLHATGVGSYVWTPGGIPFAVIGVRPLVNTTYTVAVTNSYNCTTYDSFTVNVIPPGVADAGSDLVVCTGDSILLNGSQQNAGGVIWSTSGDGIFLPDSTSASVQYVAGITDTTLSYVNLILTTTGACLNQSDTLNVIIQHHPYINAGPDTTLSSNAKTGVKVPLTPNTINVSGIKWTTSGTGIFTPSDTTLNAVYTPSEADFGLNSVILTATTTGSCTPVADALIIDFTPFVIPNIFTPDPTRPGYKDFFVIRFLTKNTILKVWDRWGTLVYTSDYYQNDWDANGLKADVYYYVVISEDKKYKGWVQVLRGE